MEPLAHAPAFSPRQAERLAADLFAVRGCASPLASERDQNFLLQLDDGQRRVLKVANALESRELLQAQNEAMARVADSASLCPRALPGRDGESIAETRVNGSRHWVRLVTYIPGAPLGSLRRQPDGLLADLGRAVGVMGRALAGFDHPALHREFHWDLAAAPALIEASLNRVGDPGLRRRVGEIADAWENCAAARTATLRRRVIHNDINDHNVIVDVGGAIHERRRRVAGIIDFGDMVHGWAAADAAVAAAYALLDQPDPLAAAAAVVSGAHLVDPFSEDELAVFFHLVRLRLGLSVCLAARQCLQRPENGYLGISQAAISRALPRLAAIHPRLAEARFRQAAGLEPLPGGRAVSSWLRAQPKPFAPVLGVLQQAGPALALDLGVASTRVHGDPARNRAADLEHRVRAAMDAAGAAFAAGGYLEPRLLYTSPLFGAERSARTVHLGIDLFAPAGTAVHAPLPGVVHLLGVNDAALDYGTLIILRHDADGEVFYTLYGHLARGSLAGLAAGTAVAAGERIGWIGTAAENGGWAPHLHLQVICDLLDMGLDFPGVCQPGERDLWAAFSPDPNLLLGLPAPQLPEPPTPAGRVLATRRARIGPSLRLKYRRPLTIERGWMQYLFDSDGRRFLDAYNNVPHVGHCHPRVVEAACGQMAVLNTNTRYLNRLLGAYAERLAATMPPGLDVCFFVNSASEANELALRLARASTARRDVIVLEGAYHGHTTSLIDISPYKHAGRGGAGAPTWVHTAPLADTYRGPYRESDPQAAQRYAGHVAEICAALAPRGGPAAFIAESCPSVGGQIFFPDGYLAAVYSLVRRAGGVCIADEVQTGYGRLGRHFYGFTAQGVEPDIVVLGKPIGNGHPIGAVVTRAEIAASFDNGMEFFSTFGGNTVSCAVGLAVLDVLEREGLAARAQRCGERLLAGLRQLQGRHAVIGDVRGAGLFIGIDFVRDPVRREPAGAEAAFVVERLREEGILTGTEGMHDNVIKVRPPMPFGDGDADFFLATLGHILDEEFG